MIRHGFLILTSSLLIAGVRSAEPQGLQSSLVEVHGHKLNVVLGGTATAGTPTVVFSNGLGAPIALWNDVRSDLDSLTRTIAYDRGGTFGSGPMTDVPTMKQIVSDLHEMLLKIDASPPYVLVGHSYGGVIIHSFAAKYRNEVVGLVYVDPTDFNQTADDLRVVLNRAGVKGGLATLAKLNEQALAAAPSGVAAEAREIDRAQEGGFAEYRAEGEAPDVPTVVLLAGKAQSVQATPTFPGNAAQFFEALRDQRVEHFSHMIEAVSNGTLVLTTNSSHIMQSTEPDLIGWSIRRVLAAAGPSRPDLERLTGRYVLTPAVVITISRLGDKLFLQATDQPLFLMTPESPTIFRIKAVGARIEFELNGAGAATALSLVQNGAHQRAPRAK